MEKLKQLKALPWKIILPVAVLVITLALNIWLGCMPVFKGKYVNKREGVTTSIRFYDNTFYSTSKRNDEVYERNGFYVADKDGVYCDTYGSSSHSEFDRESVFSFYYEDTEYTGYSYIKIKVRYVCAEAVILQIVYIAIMLGCLIFLTHIWLRTKNQDNIITTEDSRDEIEKPWDESNGDWVQDEEGNWKYISGEEESE